MSGRESLVEECRALAVDAATRAGALLRERFTQEPSGVDTKSTRTDLVSDADRDAEAILLEVIQCARPTDSIIAEESGALANQGDVRWHVDPLDGTINYLWQIPHWSVSVHAQDEEGDLVGVVFDPLRDELFVATPGSCSLNDRTLALSDGPSLATALLATGFSYDSAVRCRQVDILRKLIDKVRDIRRNGSAALDLAWVAAGRVDLYYEHGLSIWDHAAGGMIVRQAGGRTHLLDATSSLPSGLAAGKRDLVGPLMDLLHGVGATS